MRRPDKHFNHLPCPILVLVGLMIGGTLALEPAEALAQVAGPSWSVTGSLNGGRGNHTATLLPDGKVLVAGGGGWSCYGNICYSTVFNTAELYNPATGTWRYTGDVGQRVNHTATMLPNGQVLIAGGAKWGGAFIIHNSALLYDPATGRWHPTGSLITGRSDHTATLLPNGKVLVAGGGDANRILRSAELYDPVTETWSSTGAPSTISKGHVATLLYDGKVLAASGDFAELYDPATGRWSDTSPPRALGSPSTATLLADGQVLVTGTQNAFSTATTAELYNPTTGEWTTTTPLSGIGSWHTATLLTNGQVLVAGGVDSNEEPISSAQIYDPATGVWRLTSALNPPRGLHRATLLLDGKVLVAGGFSDGYYSDFHTNLKSVALFELGQHQAGTVTSVSSASFRLTGLASEAIATGFGTGLASTTLGATTLPLPTELAGTNVKVKDSAGIERLAPLLFVSPVQVNYQIPPGTAAGAATVIISSGDGTVSSGIALIRAVAPSLFTASADGRGVAAAIALRVKADGSQSYEPVAQFDATQNKFIARALDLGPEGEEVYLILFGTGIRQRSSLSAVIATIGGEYAEVSYAGAQGDFVGLDQINLHIPRSLAGRGEIDVLLTMDALMANTVRVYIK